MITRRQFIIGSAAAGAGAVTAGHKLAWALDCDCKNRTFQRTAKGSFARIFPEAEHSLDNAAGEVALQSLAESMTSTVDPASASNRFPGYTYFGQFIDHDLTWNRVRYDASACEQIAASNFRSSFLDLDSVYGEGPPLNCQFTGPTGAESFIVGQTAPNPNLGLNGGSLKDVPFEGNRPIIGDRLDFRNAENLILRQLHVVFMKFHNQVIAKLPYHRMDPAAPKTGTLFERARRLVTWTYQWLVWNDFFGKNFRAIGMTACLKRLNEPSNSPYRLPLEFVLAGFRFGHSMVQGEYGLNCHHAFPDKAAKLADLINASQDSFARLTEDYVVQWSLFFPPRDALQQDVRQRPKQASAIDTHINPALAKLPIGVFRLFSSTQEQDGRNLAQNLAYRTLLRGARAGLASGQQVAKELKKEDNAISDLTNQLKADTFLQKAGLTENTPLWYYILKEAEETEYGDRLGRVGTHLVEIALESALQNDPKSFLVVNGDKWTPPEWILPKDHRTMAALIKFADPMELAEGCRSQ